MQKSWREGRGGGPEKSDAPAGVAVLAFQPRSYLHAETESFGEVVTAHESQWMSTAHVCNRVAAGAAFQMQQMFQRRGGRAKMGRQIVEE